MKLTLNELETEYSENESYRQTADNLTNGYFDVDDLKKSERKIHLQQAWDIYESEAVKA